MSLPWFKLFVGLPYHRKSRRLSVLLGEEEAYLYCIKVQLECAANFPDGDFVGKGAADLIEQAAKWRGKRGVLVRAMCEAGFLERIDAGFRYHNWQKEQGSHVRKVKTDSKKPDGRKDKGKTSIPRGILSGVSGDVRGSLENPSGADVRVESKEILEPPSPPAGGSVAKGKSSAPPPFVQPPSPAAQAHASGPPLFERLGEVFQRERGHPWQPHPRHDAEAVTAVLRASGGDEPEILRRWAIALRTGYPRCKNLRDLAEHWNSYGAEPPGLPAKPVDPGRLARPESMPCAVRGCSTPSEGEVWGQRLCPWHFGRADRELDATQLNARGAKAWVAAQIQAQAGAA